MSTPSTPSPSRGGGRGRGPSTDPARLDLAGLRRALHGWWFGNPLMEVAPDADITASARELAERGATPGSAFIQLCAQDATPAIRLALLLPPEAPTEALLRAATHGLAKLASSRFGVEAAATSPGMVGLGAGDGHARITLREAPDATILTVELPYMSLGATPDPPPALRVGEALLAAWLRHLNLHYLDLSPRQESEGQDNGQHS